MQAMIERPARPTRDVAGELRAGERRVGECRVGERPAARSPWLDARYAYTPRPADGRIDLALDANEGRMLPAARRALEDVAARPAGLSRYPSFTELEEAIAERWGVAPERVVATAGGDEAIARVCASRLAPGAKLAVYEPAFPMFAAYGASRGAQAIGLSWADGEEFPFQASAELVVGCPSLGLLCLASPANPTGAAAPAEAVLALTELCAERGTAFLYDGAYAEFADEDPSARLAAGGSSFIVRTFSKAYGLAGLRIGYAIAPSAEEAMLLRAAGSPYPSSPLAAELALAGLGDEAGIAVAVRRVRKEREELMAFLVAAGARPEPSQANFVFVRVADALSLRDGLAALGIGIRAFAAPGLRDAVRISCPGDEADFSRLLRALDSLRSCL